MTEPHMLTRTTDPDTSQDAAAIAALSPSSTAIKSAILTPCGSTDPRTAFELREFYFRDRWKRGWPECQPNTINRRVSDLKNAGLLVDSGRRRTTTDGHPAIVWRAVTATERNILMTRYGLGGLIDIEDIEVDWSKVTDPKRLRARIAELEEENIRLRRGR